MADNIVELVKERNAIEDVVEGMGYPLQQRGGRYRRGTRADCDSLVVDAQHQCYHWNSKSEHGDVINWVMRRNNLDFSGAVEWLCERAKLPAPRWGGGDQQARATARAVEDAWSVALHVMCDWLRQDAEAMGYARGRGWCDQTIVDAQLGFSGRGSAAELKDMRGEMSLNGVDLEGVAAVAITGFRGDVRGWAKAHNLADHPQWNKEWEAWGFVPGMMGKTRVVYAHVVQGRVRYFSGRNVLGAEVNKEGREIKSYNLPVILGGPRQVFYNHVYAPKSDACVIVEGQADAITLGQWGLAGVAIVGTAFNDHALLLGELRKRHSRLYLALDGDEAGQNALVGHKRDWPLAEILGPMCRVIRWPKLEWSGADGKQRTTKDANDLLQRQVALGGEGYYGAAK